MGRQVRTRPFPEAFNTPETLAEIRQRCPHANPIMLRRTVDALFPPTTAGRAPSLGGRRFYSPEQRQLLLSVCTLQVYSTMRYEHLFLLGRLAEHLGISRVELFETLIALGQEEGLIPVDTTAPAPPPHVKLRTSGRARVLQALATRDEATASQLSDLVSSPVPSVTKWLRSLQEEGLIDRARYRPGNGEPFHYHLTDSGRLAAANSPLSPTSAPAPAHAAVRPTNGRHTPPPPRRHRQPAELATASAQTA
ncbi:MAG: helix-turn-helix domain-containing protein [Candidatus Dormibacteraeota bacterium]|nr:helix-turn-helix domain-containing protein [Candidatus Dormibacteraeota bacterium]